MATTTTWLITGTSRGIGLALVARLLQDPSNVVIAACRAPEKAHALKDLSSGAKGKLHVIKIDVADASSIRAAYEPVSAIVGKGGIDVLYNNAGVLLADHEPFSIDTDVMVQEFVTNVVGPTLVNQTFLSLVEKSRRKTIINISSGLASIGVGSGPAWPSYSVTKTALNMLTYKEAVGRPDLTIVALNPGWTKTELGGSGALLEVEDSVNGITNVLATLKHEDSGAFINYDGVRIPW